MGWVVNVTPLPRFSPRERNPGTHCTGGLECPRAGLDTEKILSPLPRIEPRSNLDRPVVQPDTILTELPGSRRPHVVKWITTSSAASFVTRILTTLYFSTCRSGVSISNAWLVQGFSNGKDPGQQSPLLLNSWVAVDSLLEFYGIGFMKCIFSFIFWLGDLSGRLLKRT
jgi:hypothetical protein